MSTGSLRIALISTPRAGNNWLRRILAGVYAITPLASHSPAEVDWETLAPECVLGIHWHPTADFRAQLERHAFQVVVLARHPLDVLISVLHFARANSERDATRRWLVGEGGNERSIAGVAPRSAAFLEYATGERAAALLSVSHEWWQVPDCLRVRYEELLAEPEASIYRLADELGAPPRRPVPEVLAETTLANLRAVTGSRSHFWRGRAGLWRSVLTAADAQRIAERHAPVFAGLGYACDPDPALDAASADARWLDLVAGERTHVCTVATVAELAHARVLAAMLVAADPGARLHCLVLDDVEETVAPAEEPFHVLRLADLGLAEGMRLAGELTPGALRARVKPALMRSVLERTQGAPVVFLAVDSAVYGDLGPLIIAAQATGIALVPRLREAVPSDGYHPNMTDVLRAGVFDEGCFALAPGDRATELLALAESALAEGPDRAAERWLDITVTVFPEASVVREPGIGLAYWNLHERRVQRREGRPFVDDYPLRVLRLTGFDPQRPGRLSDHESRIDLSYQPALSELCFAYADALAEAGWEELRDRPYGFAGDFYGLPMDDLLDGLWSEAVETGELLQSPFTAQGGKAFLRWLAQPATQVPGGGISRFWWRVWSAREDLRLAFPRVANGEIDDYLGWIHDHDPAEHRVPDALTPPKGPAVAVPARDPAPGPSGIGVNLVAPAGSVAADRLIAALDEAGVLVHLDRVPGAGVPSTPFPITLFVGGPRRFDELAAHLDEGARAGRIHVGLFSWALEGTAITGSALHLLDEVWVPSEHVARGARRQLGCPVATVRVPVEIPPGRGPSRAELGLSSAFLVLTTVDLRVGVQRKNPIGAVRAFTAAFGPNEDALMVLALYGAEAAPEAAAGLRRLADGHPHVRVLEEAPLGPLLSTCDCMLSLHRAEAFALPLAQGLALGKPVVATGYSGNLEFMRHDTSFLVNAVVRPVRPDEPTALEWADPDPDHAAALLRTVRARPGEATERSRRGAALMHARYAPRAAGEAIRTLLLRLALRPGAEAARPASAEDIHRAEMLRALRVAQRAPNDHAPALATRSLTSSSTSQT